MNKNKSEKTILQTIYDNPGISRINVSKILRINKVTVSEKISELIASGLVLETGTGDSTAKGGRRPIQLQCNYDYALCMGFDIAKDYVSYVLTNLNMEILLYNSLQIDITKNNVIDTILDCIHKHQDSIAAHQGKLCSCSFAIHGIVDNHKIKFTPNYNLDRMDLKRALEPYLPHIKIHLINESNAAALFEYFSTKIKNLVTINAKSGLGAGIIANGTLLSGVEGYGGEVGHMIVEPDGLLCRCGNKGCFEQYCSETADIAYFNSISDHKIDSTEELIILFKEKNIEAHTTIHRNIKYMSLGINNIMKTIAPEAVFINSRLAFHLEEYLPLLKNTIKASFKQKISIAGSKYSDKSTVMGAVYLSITDFLRFNL